MMDLETLDQVTHATIQMLDRLADMTPEEAEAYFDNFICEWAKDSDHRELIKAINLGYQAGHLKASMQLLGGAR